MKKIFIIYWLLIILLIICSCNMHDIGGPIGYYPGAPEFFNRIGEMDFVLVTDENRTVSLELTSNDAAYSQIKQRILTDQDIPKDMIKIEEIVNYFDYDLPLATNAISMSSKCITTPWNNDTHLLALGLKTKEFDVKSLKKNLIFLIDVSGSMDGEYRLGFIKEAFKALVEQLDIDDTISIVTYASTTAVYLEGVKGNQHDYLFNKIDSLIAGGSTAGGEGIQKAFALAKKYQSSHDFTSILLATDGDFNVGISNSNDLKDMLLENRENGIFLSTLGVGTGNFQDQMFQVLAKYGGGNYSYIGNSDEARTVLVKNQMGFFNVVAQEAKSQITFLDRVSEYRMIGYENKRLTNEEYENSDTIAGSLCANDCIIIIFELKMTTNVSFMDIFSWEIKYNDIQTQECVTSVVTSSEIISNNTILDINIEDMIFISCLIEFGLLLFDSKYKANASFLSIIARMEDYSLADDPIRGELKVLILKLVDK